MQVRIMTAENGSPSTSDWEPYSHVLIDAGNPSSTQFLTVLEWGGSSFTKSNTVLVQSSAGQNFDGALVGGTLVMFMRNWPATFTQCDVPGVGRHNTVCLGPHTEYDVLDFRSRCSCNGNHRYGRSPDVQRSGNREYHNYNESLANVKGPSEKDGPFLVNPSLSDPGKTSGSGNMSWLTTEPVVAEGVRWLYGMLSLMEDQFRQFKRWDLS